MNEAEDHFDNIDPLWFAVLSGEAPVLRRGRNFFKLISPAANARCRVCFAPFEGIAAPFARWMGPRALACAIRISATCARR
jgi:hypothetical protein